MRFEDRLQVEYVIDESILKRDVPSLILQPLVENAIKHAINHMEAGGKIKITACLEHERLLLTVSDDGPGIAELADGPYGAEAINFSGVGLKNIVDRLESLYGKSAEVSMLTKRGRGLTVQIRLPVEHS